MNINHVKPAWVLALCAAAGCSVASAGTATTTPGSNLDVPHIAVHYDASLLASDAGARVVYRRLVRAAEEVCPNPTGSHLVSAVILNCRNQAVARAVSEIGNPRLAAAVPGHAISG